MGKKKSQKEKIILPPELPPEISEDEIEVSDDDLQFVDQNRDYAGFVSRLDTQSITKHVTRVADVKEDALEALYEKRLKRKQSQKEQEYSGPQVDPVDALPVKTLDGKLYYRSVKESQKESVNNLNEAGETEGYDEDGNGDKSMVKMTKAERRAKLKKIKREAKKKEKELGTAEAEEEKTPQAAVLAEVKEDLTAEEAFETKKRKIAELGNALLMDPESNIRSLKEFLQICKDNDPTVVKLGILSLLAVFKDIIPGYRIRLPTEKELQMKVSKDVKKMRFYESTLLSSYKEYLLKLTILGKQSSFQRVVIRCICTLLDEVPHFNFRESLIGIVVSNISSPDDVIRRVCCSTIKSIYSNEGRHGGEATLEAVRLIADLVKAHNCQLHPDSIEVFLSLSFDEDLRRREKTDENNKGRNKKSKKRKNLEEPTQLQGNEKKKSKHEMVSKMREEVAADYKSVAFTQDIEERRRMQTDTLSAVFETYFRILKHTVQQTAPRSEGNVSQSVGASASHPLLAPCLRGLAKFSHLLDLDFMGDLINHLKRLASAGSSVDNVTGKCLASLTVSERLQCCIVAFKVMRSNLDALNVDLQDFFVQLYNLILEYRPGRDQGEVLAEALKLLLCEDRQHDMQKAAAFVKRLATFSLCFGCAESMAALVTLKHLLQKNVKCRNLLENDAGGGSVSGSIAKYQPYASDPNLSGALASVLWELNLLSKHYHPSISTMASNLSNSDIANNPAYLSILSPVQAFASHKQELFDPPSNIKNLNKRKQSSRPYVSAAYHETSQYTSTINEDEVRKKLASHFVLLRDIKENKRLRCELDRVTSSLQLYKEYKQEKKKSEEPKSKKSRPLTEVKSLI